MGIQGFLTSLVLTALIMGYLGLGLWLFAWWMQARDQDQHSFIKGMRVEKGRTMMRVKEARKRAMPKTN